MPSNPAPEPSLAAQAAALGITGFDYEALLQEVSRAMAAAMDTDPSQFAGSIETIIRMGPKATHAAIVFWAIVILERSGLDISPDTPPDPGRRLDLADPETGAWITVDDLPPGAERDALQIAEFVARRDRDGVAGIVKAAITAGAEPLIALMSQSVALAAAATLEAEATTGEAR
jgi:hypothetical protein